MNGIGTLNPIRYRGYYYDTETGLYYLRARYYDPETGRFISQDDVSYLAPMHLSGLNLYAYCNDNPVMYADPCGTSVFLTCFLIGIIAGAIIGGTLGGITAYNLAVECGATGFGLIGATIMGVLGGAIIGGAIGAVVGAVVGGIASVVGSLFGSMGGGTLVLTSGEVVASEVAFAGVAIETAVGVGAAVGAIGVGISISMFSKPNSGRIRFSDGTGIDPDTGKQVSDKDRAYEIFKQLKDPIEKANWKKWMKGKGWRTSHLHDFLWLALVAEWFDRLCEGEYFG